MKYKVTIKSCLLYIVMFLSIYLSGSGILVLGEGTNMIKIMHVLLIGILFFMTIMSGRIMSVVACAGWAFSFFVINVLNYRESAFSLLLRIIWIILFFGMMEYLKNPIRLLDIYTNIMVFISKYSLVMYFCIYLLSVPIPYKIVTNGTLTYRSYLGLFFYRPLIVQRIFGLEFNEFSSLFWEHGVYGAYLVVALFYLLFIKNKKATIDIVAVSLNIFLTFSTTFLIVMIGLYVVYLLLFSKTINKRDKLIIMIPLIFLALITSYVIFNYKKMNSGSYILRMSDLEIGLKLFAMYPILGTGFRSDAFSAMQGFDRGSSNGMITIMYSMGMVGLLAYVYPFLKRLKRSNIGSNNMWIKRLLFAILFMVINLSEPLYLSPIIILTLSAEYYMCTTKYNRECMQIKTNNNMAIQEGMD